MIFGVQEAYFSFNELIFELNFSNFYFYYF